MRQICYQPRVLLALSHVGETDEMRVQDASAFAACREELSYWELMVRPNVHSTDSQRHDVLEPCLGVWLKLTPNSILRVVEQGVIWWAFSHSLLVRNTLKAQRRAMNRWTLPDVSPTLTSTCTRVLSQTPEP